MEEVLSGPALISGTEVVVGGLEVSVDVSLDGLVDGLGVLDTDGVGESLSLSFIILSADVELWVLVALLGGEGLEVIESGLDGEHGGSLLEETGLENSEVGSGTSGVASGDPSRVGKVLLSVHTVVVLLDDLNVGKAEEFLDAIEHGLEVTLEDGKSVFFSLADVRNDFLSEESLDRLDDGARSELLVAGHAVDDIVSKSTSRVTNTVEVLGLPKLVQSLDVADDHTSVAGKVGDGESGGDGINVVDSGETEELGVGGKARDNSGVKSFRELNSVVNSGSHGKDVRSLLEERSEESDDLCGRSGVDAREDSRRVSKVVFLEEAVEDLLEGSLVGIGSGEELLSAFSVSSSLFKGEREGATNDAKEQKERSAAGSHFDYSFLIFLFMKLIIYLDFAYLVPHLSLT